MVQNNYISICLGHHIGVFSAIFLCFFVLIGCKLVAIVNDYQCLCFMPDIFSFQTVSAKHKEPGNRHGHHFRN